MQEIARAPLTFGQLSVWRSIEDVPLAQALSANLHRTWPLPEGCTVTQVRAALDNVQERHEALRTGFSLSGPRGIEQVLWAADPVEAETVELGHEAAVKAPEVTARLAAEPLRLAQERPWRVAVVTDGGVPVWLALCIHHMAADGAGIQLFHDELMRALKGATPTDKPPTCRELAAEQSSPGWDQRRRGTLAHWHRTMAAAGPVDPGPDPDAPVCWGRLRSVPAGHAARRLAGELGISVHSVVFAGFCRVLGDRTGQDSLLIALLTANRTDDRARDLLSSMTQLVPLHVELRPNEPFRDLARRLHMATLLAYRHGAFDVDEVARELAPYGRDGSGGGFRYFFNYMSDAAAARTPQPVPDPAEGPGWRIETAATGRDNGFPLYFRAGADNDLWVELRDRAEGAHDGAGQELTAATHAMLSSFHELVIAEASTAAASGREPHHER